VFKVQGLKGPTPWSPYPSLGNIGLGSPLDARGRCKRISLVREAYHLIPCVWQRHDPELFLGVKSIHCAELVDGRAVVAGVDREAVAHVVPDNVMVWRFRGQCLRQNARRFHHFVSHQDSRQVTRGCDFTSR
jgi:hypothetical protein